MELAVPAGENGQVYKIKLVNPFDDSNVATFTQWNSKTPTLPLNTALPVAVGSHQLSLTIDTQTGMTPSKLYVSNVLNPSNRQ